LSPPASVFSSVFDRTAAAGLPRVQALARSCVVCQLFGSDEELLQNHASTGPNV
jgi:hypothetical protein